MTTTNNSWDLIEAAYDELAGYVDPNDGNLDAVNPDEISDWVFPEAASHSAYSNAAARFPEIALLEAMAENGYLEDHRIWEAITEAIGDGLRAFAEERWEEAEREREAEEDWEE